MVPQLKPRQTFANWTPLLDELSDRTGLRFRLIVPHPRVPIAHGDAVRRAIIACATTASGVRVLQTIAMKEPVNTSVKEYEFLRTLGL